MVRVLVYVDELTSTSIPVEMAAKAHLRSGVEVVLVSHFDKKTDNIDPDVEEMDIPMIRLGASSRVDFGAIKRLRRICTSQDIDILHTHPIAIGTVARLMMFGLDVGIITTEHNDRGKYTYIQKTSDAVTYPSVNTIVSNSKSTKESLNWWERFLSRSCRHVTIYNGIDTDRIDSVTKLDYKIDDSDGPLAVTVGRSVNQKNHETLLRSFQTVVETNPEVTLAIVGDGPLLTTQKQLASELGISDSVLFTGYLPRREDVYSVLKQSTLAVFPSWYEGFCVAAVEAMASGLPVVASDIDVFHEVIDDGGLYAPPDDPHAFSEKILTLLNNPQMRSQIGDVAAERAKQKFTLERTGEEYAQLYREIADEQY